MRTVAALILALLLLSGSSSPGQSDVRSVTFSRNFAYAICAGVCPVYDLTVTPDGLVDVQQRGALNEHFRFRVSRSAAQSAIATVSPFRSATQTAPRATCAVPLGANPALFDPSVEQFAIEWHSQRGTERLVACPEDERTVSAFNSAISALGVGPTGLPFVKQRIDGSRYGQQVSCDLGNGRWSQPRYDCSACPPDAIKSTAKFYAVD